MCCLCNEIDDYEYTFVTCVHALKFGNEFAQYYQAITKDYFGLPKMYHLVTGCDFDREINLLISIAMYPINKGRYKDNNRANLFDNFINQLNLRTKFQKKSKTYEKP